MWDELFGLLSLLGTGFGMYSNYENSQNQQRAYDNAVRQSMAYDNQIQNYYRDYAKYQQDLMMAQMGLMSGLMGTAQSELGGAQNRLMGLMGTPIDPMGFYNQFYNPLTNAEVGGLRRGITAQQALRTNGNEGMYIDALVGEGIRARESAISQAALDRAVQAALGQRQGEVNLAQADVGLTSAFFGMLPGMLGAASRGFVAPPEPIRPYSVPYPTMSPYPTSQLGDYFKWQTLQNEKSKPQSSPMPAGQTAYPVSVYDPLAAAKYGPYEWPW